MNVNCVATKNRKYITGKNLNFYSLFPKLLIMITAVVFLFPFYWMLITSLQPETAAVTTTPVLIPRVWALENYIKLTSYSNFARWNFNSIFISLVATVLVCVTASMAGYVLAKKKIPGARLVFVLMVITMALPRQTILVPLFTMMKDINLVNTYAGLILPRLGVPSTVFLMKQFIQTVPTEILESSKIDGCNEFGIFYRILVPIIIPAISALAIFTFVGVYNEYFWQLMMIRSSGMKTLPLAVASLQEEFNPKFTLLMAGAVMASLPMITVFVFFQKYFMQGLTIGAVKG